MKRHAVRLFPVRSRHARDLVTEQLVRMILDHRLRSGDQLPTERELQRQLSVGRSTVREALLSLAARGIVEIHQGKGVFVTRVPAAVLRERLRALDRVSAVSLGEVWAVREALETRVAMLAAERRTEGYLRRMVDALNNMDVAVARGRSGEIEDALFHHYLVRASRNSLLHLLLEDIASLVAQTRRRALATPGRPVTSNKEHRAILEAVREGDATLAGERMYHHLSFGRMLTTRPPQAAQGG